MTILFAITMLFGANVSFVIHTMTSEHAVVEIGNGKYDPTWIEFRLKDNEVTGMESLDPQIKSICETKEKTNAV